MKQILLSATLKPFIQATFMKNPITPFTLLHTLLGFKRLILARTIR